MPGTHSRCHTDNNAPWIVPNFSADFDTKRRTRSNSNQLTGIPLCTGHNKWISWSHAERPLCDFQAFKLNSEMASFRKYCLAVAAVKWRAKVGLIKIQFVHLISVFHESFIDFYRLNGEKIVWSWEGFFQNKLHQLFGDHRSVKYLIYVNISNTWYIFS